MNQQIQDNRYCECGRINYTTKNVHIIFCVSLFLLRNDTWRRCLRTALPRLFHMGRAAVFRTTGSRLALLVRMRAHTTRGRTANLPRFVLDSVPAGGVRLRLGEGAGLADPLRDPLRIRLVQNTFAVDGLERGHALRGPLPGHIQKQLSLRRLRPGVRGGDVHLVVQGGIGGDSDVNLVVQGEIGGVSILLCRVGLG